MMMLATLWLASCAWVWDCTGGTCRQVPICDTPMAIPGPRPPGVPPIAPPTLTPIPEPVLPPLGTRSCAPRHICTSRGVCQWQTVCS